MLSAHRRRIIGKRYGRLRWGRHGWIRRGSNRFLSHLPANDLTHNAGHDACHRAGDEAADGSARRNADGLSQPRGPFAARAVVYLRSSLSYWRRCLIGARRFHKIKTGIRSHLQAKHSTGKGADLSAREGARWPANQRPDDAADGAAHHLSGSHAGKSADDDAGIKARADPSEKHIRIARQLLALCRCLLAIEGRRLSDAGNVSSNLFCQASGSDHALTQVVRHSHRKRGLPCLGDGLLGATYAQRRRRVVRFTIRS